MSPISIRAVHTSTDFDALRVLLREYVAHLSETLGAGNVCIEQYEQELSALPSPYQTLLLAFAGEEDAAGCVLLKAIQSSGESPPDEKACELKRLWVRPQFRGRGLGRNLTGAALSEAKRQGYTAMYLDTVPAAMQAAHRMYLELGFQPTERYNDNPVSHVAFFRRLL